MTTPGFRVRRLAVIDLHGFGGTKLRLWLVRVEFVLAVVLAAGLGGLFLRTGTIEGICIGIASIGIAANNAVLSGWAMVLRRERLAKEFTAHNVEHDGRFYSIGQIRLVVPFLFPVLAVRACERRV